MKIFGYEMQLINQQNIKNLLNLKEKDRITKTNSEKCGSIIQNKFLNYLTCRSLQFLENFPAAPTLLGQ